MSLRRNTLWNLAGLGLPLLAGAALVPFLLRSLGVEAFGVLTLVWALIGYFSLFDVGLGRALTQQVARRLATQDVQGLHAMVKSGLLLATGTGVAGGLLLACFASPLALLVLNISDALREDVFYAFLVAALAVPVTTATVGLRGVLEAYEDFRDVNLLRMLLGISNFGLPALSIVCFGPSLVWMVASLTVSRLIVGVGHWLLVRRRLGAALGRAAWGFDHSRRLLSFGIWMTVSSVISPLMVTADRFVISAVMGAAVVAYYTVPAEAVARLLIVPGALTSALFPRLAALMSHDAPAAHRLYHRCVLVVAAALLPVSVLAAVGAHPALALWLGQAFADRAAPVLSILAVGLLLNGIAFVPFAAVQAAGLAHITAKLHIVEALFYFPLLLWALQTHGLAGAAVAWTGRVGADLALLAWMAHRCAFRQQAMPALRHNFPSIEQRTTPP